MGSSVDRDGPRSLIVDGFPSFPWRELALTFKRARAFKFTIAGANLATARHGEGELNAK